MLDEATPTIEELGRGDGGADEAGGEEISSEVVHVMVELSAVEEAGATGEELGVTEGIDDAEDGAPEADTGDETEDVGGGGGPTGGKGVTKHP